jgi:glucose-1-phosphate adenylyltransferase
MSSSVDPNRVLSIILGGGAGTRLFPLTKERAKPAVPLAGKYRLVDIPISLCLNSGLKRIFLLTQYLSSSLHRHVQQSYFFDNYQPRGFIEILAAAQNADATGWYQGTADAVRQNMIHFETHRHDLVLILSGDQLYRMDYRDILKAHVDSGADVTVATIPVAREPARSFGIMQIDAQSRVVRFVEKPKEDALLDSLKLSPESIGKAGLLTEGDLFLASMGIYVFNRSTLKEALENPVYQDFGKDIIPTLIHSHKVCSYVYQGYWEDIGTIRAFYDANLDVTEPVPKFDFFDAVSPIYSRARYLPASKIHQCRIERATIADGCILSHCEVVHANIGLRSRIQDGTVVRNTVMMGADFYETAEEIARNREKGIPQIGIGRNCVIENAIIDKNARIGNNVMVRTEGKPSHVDNPLYYIRDGIVVIPKNTVIPDNTVI